MVTSGGNDDDDDVPFETSFEVWDIRTPTST